ncbi:hypothetical protein [Desulfobacula phenolica]|nr:hypothetical protein [Desulfobacula phenolica]
MAALLEFKGVEINKETASIIDRFFESSLYKKTTALAAYFGEWGSFRFIFEIIPRWKASKTGRKNFYIGVVNVVITWLIFQIKA